MVMALSSQMSV